jgi:hypothetical protein
VDAEDAVKGKGKGKKKVVVGQGDQGMTPAVEDEPEQAAERTAGAEADDVAGEEQPGEVGQSAAGASQEAGGPSEDAPEPTADG